jgi:hypothetical protein
MSDPPHVAKISTLFIDEHDFVDFVDYGGESVKTATFLKQLKAHHARSRRTRS